jgi:carbamoyl-phosphate synthase large subunit
MRILTEASGSLTSAYLITSIQTAGHVAVASDIYEDCFGRYLADDFIVMPPWHEKDYWPQIKKSLLQNKIDLVIPSFDETLLGWSQRKNEFEQLSIHLVTSLPNTLKTCQNKWLTYLFFKDNGIPCPKTSQEQVYPLVKPVFGRGATGVRVEKQPINMDGMISQEIAKGQEYTVDIFCLKDGKPLYIIPRKRVDVRDGKSVSGIVDCQPVIEKWVRKICTSMTFIGPVNIQCFLSGDQISFIEINPRIAGGMALGFAASENWIGLIVDHLIYGKTPIPKPVRNGLKMKRYYAELFI